MKKAIYKFTVTPVIDKQLKEIAEVLPAISKINKAGQPLVVHKSKHIPWAELSDLEKVKYPTEEYWPAQRGQAPRPKLYIIRWTEPSEENHHLNMYWKFKEFGEEGVAKYVDWVNEITEASKKAAAEISKQEAAAETI